MFATLFSPQLLFSKKLIERRIREISKYLLTSAQDDNNKVCNQWISLILLLMDVKVSNLIFTPYLHFSKKFFEMRKRKFTKYLLTLFKMIITRYIITEFP